jgi:pentatricopeptide repeat protein
MGAYEAYLAAKDYGAVPSAETFHNLLSLTAGLGEQGSGQAIIRDKEPPHNLSAALVVYEGMIDNNVAIAESSFTAMIRCCCINGQPFRGLQFYKDMQNQNITPKLRTLTSLLDALSVHDSHNEILPCDDTAAGHTHVEEDACTAGFALYDELLNKYGLEPTEKEYLYMLRLCLARRDDRFYTILAALSESGIVPVSAELRTVLTQWFSTVEMGYTVARSRVLKDGTVAVNGEKLKSLDVDERFREEFVQELEKFAVTFDDTKKYKMNNKVKEQQQINAMKALLQQQAHLVQGGGAPAQFSGSESHSTVGLDELSGAHAKQAVSTKEGGSNLASRQALWTEFTKFLRYHREPVHVSTATTITSTKRAVRSRSTSATEDTVVAKKTRYEEGSNDNCANQASTDGAAAVRDSAQIAGNGNSDKNRTFNGKLGFNIIVDGANVGYFKQNYLGAPNHVNYSQVDQLLHHLRALGHVPLLILHSRHLTRHMVPDEQAEEIIRRWRTEGCLYSTPKGFNDDWFWLYAAVSQRCRVVTNDEMRDHHFQLLSPK